MSKTIPKTIFVIDADSIVVLTAMEPTHKSWAYYRFDGQYLEATTACEEIAIIRNKRVSDFLHSDTDTPKIYYPPNHNSSAKEKSPTTEKAAGIKRIMA
jgi:hypothetical protein